MILHVREAKYFHDYVLWLRFNDEAEGEVDLKDELSGEVFKAVQDINRFKQFTVDPDLETVVWKNGADMALEFLYEKLRVYA